MRCVLLVWVPAGDADAFRALGNSAAELQQWVQSARAFERAAELHAVAVDRREHVECLMLAAKQWLNATAEARAMQKRAGSRTQAAQQQQQQRQQDTAANGPAALEGGSASSSSNVEDKAVLAVQPSKQQVRILADELRRKACQTAGCQQLQPLPHWRCTLCLSALHWCLNLASLRECEAMPTAFATLPMSWPCPALSCGKLCQQ